ncbi:MAG TPA: hypothetical protein VIB79_19725 [Candidatus Binatia bacterium]
MDFELRARERASLDAIPAIDYGKTPIPMVRRRSCLFTLAVLWVMWIRTQSPTAEDWTQMSGFVSETQCAANMKEKLDIWKAFSDAKFAGNSVTFTGNKTTVSYLCLPDTEDPRKGMPVKKPK